MTSFQVEYTPPLGTDRQARVRVSRGDDGREVWTREFSNEDGHFETQMINWLADHGIEDRQFVDPGGWRVDLTEAQHNQFRQGFEHPHHPLSPR
jgi:hypothetical protein